MRLSLTELAGRVEQARGHHAACRLCPRNCGVSRAGGRVPCLVGDELVLGGWGLHFGEEPCLTGRGGSGLVLLGGCNLACRGCETFSFSRELEGTRTVSAAELAGIVLELERRGAETVQFVTPTHQLPGILDALHRAAKRGFSRPVVWNCGGYEAVEALLLLDGVVDVYLPDLKHGDDLEGRLAGVPDYFARATEAIAEMVRQVGPLELDERGVARRGVLVRHLVLPDDAARTEPAMRFLAGLSPDVPVNVMNQFQPVYQLGTHPRLGRRPTDAEVDRAADLARASGLVRVTRAR